ncbi:DUF4430 domain-containing protein [Liquorilactobacillus oeni]|uniref:Transcobalamin-like C-terminal domain-containing protein n=1 Tax=Liquorilactobacillus oeni DSM 19972 TaxID=1423777 RepID=A0A0R1MAM7_9LACO|nr:DUF4430 domain-containing protein [Liquorilactobacillus oeni]KRL05389.1 hypothetical protein FD46_GL000796 [Liquorilactobacillus oeni DSM 19972]
MFKKISKFLLVLFSLGALFSYENSNPVHAAASAKKIAVTYQLKNSNRTFAHKKITLKAHSSVLSGLKKSWHVQEKKGFVTKIDKHSQNAKKSKYWTYSVNGKAATKGASSEKLANHDKVVFNLSTEK